jgi:hypothetical protein
VIGLGTAVRVLVATRPVDFRKGADSLTALVKAEYGADPFLCVERYYVAAASTTAFSCGSAAPRRHII